MSERSFILRDEFIRARIISAIHELPLDDKFPIEVIFRPFRKKRSLDANAFYWGFVVTPLAKHCGYTPEEMHEVLLKQIYGTHLVEFRNVKQEVPNKRTSDMKVAEFSDHITHVISICHEEGVRIDTARRPPNERDMG